MELTRDEFKEKMNMYNLIMLKTPEQKRILQAYPEKRTWVRYYNKNTRKFYNGGIFVGMDNRYINLRNLRPTRDWFIKIEDNILFVRTLRDVYKTIHEVDRKVEDKRQKLERQKQESEHIKNVYQMYKNGDLMTRDQCIKWLEEIADQETSYNEEQNSD